MRRNQNPLVLTVFAARSSAAVIVITGRSRRSARMLERVVRLRENIPAELPVVVESEREDDGRWMGLFVLTIDGDEMGTILTEESGLVCEVSHEGSGQSGGSSEGADAEGW
jgi:hypothetical protein